LQDANQSRQGSRLVQARGEPRERAETDAKWSCHRSVLARRDTFIKNANSRREKSAHADSLGRGETILNVMSVALAHLKMP
jgi:hypothetical protein